ncbi:MAG: CoA transferase [Deltaproteobacteria bacterium]|nr:CoA transferase [Deltaproteobacteria bacterium]
MAARKQASASRPGALAGIRVLDFSWAGAGPFVTKFLADFGAEIIKVESRKRPDIGRLTPPFAGGINHPDRSALYLHTNASKLSITLNIQHPKGKEIVKKIVGIADIVMENFTPGVMERLGFTYKELIKIKPDLIMASSSIYGQTGPKSRLSGFGNTGYSISGHYLLTGWSDREPVSPGVAYADIVQPVFTISAILAALDYRKRTGKGQYIDSTQVETMVQCIAPAMLDYFANGRVATRLGNRSPYASPHGIFPCKGDDRWCALAVFNEEEWHGLCQAMKNPPWTRDAKFATLAARKENEDELESLIAEWTIAYDRDELTTMLQKAGVPSGPAQNGSDLVDRDPQLRERQSFIKLTHPVMGEVNHPTPAIKLSATPPHMKTSPCLGEHNEYVYKELLGIPEQEYNELVNEGVFE